MARNAMENVDITFTKRLPKAELHAHLTGSITAECLHEIWIKRRQRGDAIDLADPLLTIRPNGTHHDIYNFFKLFDSYIYALCNTVESVKYATAHVLQSFQNDGVRYLELRTTPRAAPASGMSKEAYVQAVLDVIKAHGRYFMPTNLILSIDRRNSSAEAMAVVDLAIQHRDHGVVGVDLCGNPLKGDVSIFAEAFSKARDAGLKITLHFAEMPESSTDEELRTLLSFQPDRIGHVINVSATIQAEIERRRLGLELCLSCNVHAKMIQGGFSDHHFGMWHRTKCPVALSVRSRSKHLWIHHE